MLQTINLPRQARDKHSLGKPLREKEMGARFLQALVALHGRNSSVWNEAFGIYGPGKKTHLFCDAIYI
jgi:hypothetical protein